MRKVSVMWMVKEVMGMLQVALELGMQSLKVMEIANREGVMKLMQS